MTNQSPNQKRKIDCERSFLKPLYHLNEDGQTVLIDETTGELFLEKRLTVYNIRVYEWLKHHAHPHLVSVRDFWSNDDGTLTVIESYINGKTLENCADALSDEQKRNVILDICDALIFLHGAKPSIIHRDIKAANIMVTNDGRGVLIDYDAAKYVQPDEERDTVLLGTEGVAAPEQYGFGASDVRTDVYGVGMLIKTLFPNHPAYQKIVRKATKLSPEDRYQDMRVLRQAFARVLIDKQAASKPTLKKILIALPIYAFWIMIGCITEFDKATMKNPVHLWFDRIGIICVFAAMLEVIFTWFAKTRQLPGHSSPNIIKRILITVGWTVLIGIIGIFILAILDTIIF